MKAGAKSIIAKIPAREWRGLVPYWEGGRLQVPLKCHSCGNTDHWSASQMLSPARVVPKIIRLGWQADGRLTCPACLALKHHRTEGKVIPMKPMQIVPTLKGQETSSADAAKKNKRLVIAALEDYFDETARRYRDSKTDKAVADELNVAEEFVIKVREELFAELAEPEEIVAFRSQIEGMQTGLDTLKRNFTSMCQRNGWKV